MSGEPIVGSTLVINVSEAGPHIQTLNGMSLNKRINIKVSFPKGNEFESFRVEAEIIWKDVYFWEGWGQYQYASKFVEIFHENYLKLRRLLCG
jgi:hypothetical protein